ncbi:MAG: 50S ribosomal protein L11 methyltransferase [Gammaproteobacteria bacterium]|nr:50S ribosomal protein L11 methyltransferase [Gammaproteobacteria bacterium]
MWQLEVLTNDQCSEQIEAILDGTETLSVSLVDAGEDIIIQHELHEKPRWSVVKIEALYEHESEIDQVMAVLKAEKFDAAVEKRELEQKNWMIYSLKDFQPILIAGRLWIFPHWLVPDEPPSPHVVIDPGFAFGTGQHSTTKMCLEWLATHDVKDKVLLDYGCGSGILGIAALRMGGKKTYGLDIDPQACEASLENAQLNQITQEEFTISLDRTPIPAHVDIIMANIVMNTLLEFRDYFYDTLENNGDLILSGLLREQIPIVIEHYQQRFTWIDTQYDLDWGLIIFKKR